MANAENHVLLEPLSSPQRAGTPYVEEDASEPFIPRKDRVRPYVSSRSPSRRRRDRGRCYRYRCGWVRSPIFIASAFLFFLAVFFMTPPTDRSTSNNVLFAFAERTSPLRAYPVGLTAGVIPKRFHSHNDYEQNTPLLKALSYGASSVEADIWLVDDKLLVGHTERRLSPERTFAALYLDPLLSLLNAANVNRNSTGGPVRGVFEIAPQLPLQFLIDIKTDPSTTFPRLYEALAPLRSAGYLTTATPNMSTLAISAITVVGTGNTQLENVLATGNSSHPRDVFLDAPLASLPMDESGIYNKTVSPLASVDFGSTCGLMWMFPPVGRRRIRRLVNAAHERGIQARFWNEIIAPTWARNFVWQMLLDEGVDWLNVDDLPAAKDF